MCTPTCRAPAARKPFSCCCRLATSRWYPVAVSLAAAGEAALPRAARAALKPSHSRTRSERRPTPQGTTQLSARCLSCTAQLQLACKTVINHGHSTRASLGA